MFDFFSAHDDEDMFRLASAMLERQARRIAWLADFFFGHRVSGFGEQADACMMKPLGAPTGAGEKAHSIRAVAVLREKCGYGGCRRSCCAFALGRLLRRNAQAALWFHVYSEFASCYDVPVFQAGPLPFPGGLAFSGCSSGVFLSRNVECFHGCH
ncbi:MAG: hypothetical protein ACN6OD_12105 [Alcaligenes sp.]